MLMMHFFHRRSFCRPIPLAHSPLSPLAAGPALKNVTDRSAGNDGSERGRVQQIILRQLLKETKSMTGWPRQAIQSLLRLGCVIKVDNLTILFAIWSGCHATWSPSGCSQSVSERDNGGGSCTHQPFVRQSIPLLPSSSPLLSFCLSVVQQSLRNKQSNNDNVGSSATLAFLCWCKESKRKRSWLCLPWSF